MRTMTAITRAAPIPIMAQTQPGVTGAGRMTCGGGIGAGGAGATTSTGGAGLAGTWLAVGA